MSLVAILPKSQRNAKLLIFLTGRFDPKRCFERSILLLKGAGEIDKENRLSTWYDTRG